MYSYVALVVGAVAFFWQMQLCYSGKGIRSILPGVTVLVCVLGLTLFAWIGNHMNLYSAPFAAAIFAVLLLIPLGGMVLAWGIYAVIGLVRKRKK